MKLELKHLAVYLPYDLNCTANDESFVNHPLSGLIDGVAIFAFEHGEDDYKLTTFKPILRTLEDLSEHEWMEVFMAGILQSKPLFPKSYIDMEREVIKHGVGVELIPEAGSSLSYDYKNSHFETVGIRFNSLVALDKLFEFHADVFGLIPDGLAIDTNHPNTNHP